MQIHLDRPCFESFGVPYLNTTNTGKPFATLWLGPFRLNIENEAQADQLIKAACQIKDMFRQHAGDLDAALAADLDDQANGGAE